MSERSIKRQTNRKLRRRGAEDCERAQLIGALGARRVRKPESMAEKSKKTWLKSTSCPLRSRKLRP
jgi:hypothetical protein